MRLCGWFLAVMLSVSSSAVRAEDMSIPCSERYQKTMSYAIRGEDVGANAREVLERWGLTDHHWGFERLSIVKNAKSGEPAVEFFFPKDSVNPGAKDSPRGGAGLYVTGGFSGAPAAACLQYKVYFPPGFDFAKGGKLPGFYGGENEKGETAVGCRAGSENYGFSTRYMWREKGAGSLYAYLPGKEEKCGKYIGKGSWHFTPGAWTQLEQEVVLNRPGESDGALRVWVDGERVINQEQVMIRARNVPIEGIYFVSFFGGKGPEWASPKDQVLDIAGLKVFSPR